MRFRLLIMLGILLIAIPLSAQGDCGNGLPCGPIPWELPAYPILQSPTPINADVDGSHLLVTPTITPSPTPTLTLTPTFTPSPTITPYFEQTAINGQLATLENLRGTPEGVNNAQGTPIALLNVQANMNEASIFIAYAKGLNTNIFGPFSPVVTVALFALSVGFFMTAAKVLIPILVFMVGLVRKIVSFILEFIPL